MKAVAAVVIYVTGECYNLLQYSSWENLIVAFFPVTYSDIVQWIAVANSVKVCVAQGWKDRDVVGLHPKLLVVKKNSEAIKSSTFMQVDDDFL